MKQFIVGLIAFFSIASANAQWVPVDKSPLDQIYYPNDYPTAKIRGKLNEPLRMRVLYSRPSKNNREIFGSDIVPFGEVWRLGANEATEIEFFCPATIQGKKIPKGRYTLYAIPTEKNWTFIINKDTDAWGAFNYDASKDVVRATVPVEKNDKPLESLTIIFEKSGRGVNLEAGWDKYVATLPINF
ncbi:MAG: DUF2911 domain-containing protein [Niabella sp.]